MAVAPHRLLFVDDDRRLLERTRRELRALDRGWEIELAPGGRRARGALDDERFDLVCVGLSVATPDARTLLERVRAVQPKAIRVLAVRPAERSALLHLGGLAHRFVPRGEHGRFLGGELARALDVRRLLQDVRARVAVHGVEALPSPPRTYLALCEAVRDPDVSLSEVAEIVERDAAVTAKVLQFANSSVIGLAQPATGVRRAAAHLGIDTVRSICLSTEVFARFDHELPAGFSFEEQLGHAQLVAQVLTQLVPKAPWRDHALLAALLHDVGVLIQATALPGDFEAVQRMNAHARMPLTELERRVSGVTHAELGAYLLGLWGLPFDVVEAVAHHHEPSRTGAETMEALGWVHVADALVEEAVGAPRGTERTVLDVGFLMDARVTAERVQGWRARVAELVLETSGHAA